VTVAAAGPGRELDADSVTALHVPCARYAMGLDNRDVELFLSAFTEAAQLAVEADPSGPVQPRVWHGHDEIATLPPGLNRFAHTHHMLGQHLFWMGADGPQGSIYCAARHLSRSEGGRSTDLAMFIRYLDSYAKATDGGWLIASRRVVIDWTELHEVH
jgi:hypothetical protein